MTTSAELKSAVSQVSGEVNTASVAAIQTNGDSTKTSLYMDSTAKAMNVAGSAPNKIQAPQ